jgi:uncharacterized membrane protein
MRHTDLMYNLENHTDLNVKHRGINLTRIIIGILVYNIIFVPIISFMIAVTVHLDSYYLIPIAMACALVGIYVTENFACRNIP